ncbi:hypothetical protein ACVBEQ_10890 [Nakamurella sp. GG22]
MTLSIFAPDHAGWFRAGYFAVRGHTAICLDAISQRTEFLAYGKVPVVEKADDELTAEQVASGRLAVWSEPTRAVQDSHPTIVYVGTLAAPNGSRSTEFLERTTEQIVAALSGKDGWHDALIGIRQSRTSRCLG